MITGDGKFGTAVAQSGLSIRMAIGIGSGWLNQYLILHEKSQLLNGQPMQPYEKNDPHILNWNAVRSNDHDRVHLRVRNSGQQRLLAMGDLETRRRGLDL